MVKKSLLTKFKNIWLKIIFRVISVCPSSVEPIPGWVDNLNGPVGLMIAAGKGVIRSMHCNGENRVQIIPVDLAINAIIAIGWKIGSAKTKYDNKAASGTF